MATNEGVELPAPDSREAPKYWQYEIGGELVPAMHRLISQERLTETDITLIRLYLWQWIQSPVWDRNPHLGAAGAAELATLRDTAGKIRTVAHIREWVAVATDWGMDPL